MTAEFVYNADGLRVQKTVNGVVTGYTLHGKNVVHMTKGNDELHFFYDAQNRPAVVVYNGAAYAYVKSLQGDIVAILDENGNAVVSYGYDAWGAPLWCTGELAETLGKVQPFRYRGYVFDEETGLYYLRSRYYNAQWGRFVNADNVLNICATSNCNRVPNAFAYCSNGVIQRTDTDGKLWDLIFDIVSFVGSVVDVIENPTDPWAWASLTGDAIDLFTPLLSGCGEATRALRAATTVIDAADTAKDVAKSADTVVDLAKTVHKRWHVGDPIDALTAAGKVPSWSTIRQRFWKTIAALYPDIEQSERLQRGLAMLDEAGTSIELHHPKYRKGENLFTFGPIRREDHILLHSQD